MGLLQYKFLKLTDKIYVCRYLTEGLHVKTTCGVLKYARNSADEAFRLYLDEISDTEGLIHNIKSFETEYGRNVQEYTYQHIKASLGENMSIENEYYEDDELYLTINIDE